MESTGITADKFLIGNFKQAATLYDRWEARVEVSTEHDDFFTRNLVAILAEERLGLAVKRATALTTATSPTPPPTSRARARP